MNMHFMATCMDNSDYKLDRAEVEVELHSQNTAQNNPIRTNEPKAKNMTNTRRMFSVVFVCPGIGILICVNEYTSLNC